MIGMARAMGVPARYVTGYLVTGTGATSTAAHAWAETLVPDLGWVGFDAANGICPDDHYVRVAAGIDAAGVTPIRGTRRGGLMETMTVEVRVEIAQQ
jgi:transglutaminase-like putative cysteine protease